MQKTVATLTLGSCLSSSAANTPHTRRSARTSALSASSSFIFLHLAKHCDIRSDTALGDEDCVGGTARGVR